MYIVVNSYGSAVRSVEGTDGSGMDSPFADYQKHFVFYFIRKADPPQLQATYPSGYIGVLHCIKDIAEFIRLFRCIIFGCPADKCIQFFVVIILYLFADGSQQAVTFANFVLSASLYVDFLYFLKTVQFSVIYFLLQSFVADIPGNHCHDGEQHQTNYKYPHNYESNFRKGTY